MYAYSLKSVPYRRGSKPTHQMSCSTHNTKSSSAISSKLTGHETITHTHRASTILWINQIEASPPHTRNKCTRARSTSRSRYEKNMQTKQNIFNSRRYQFTSLLKHVICCFFSFSSSYPAHASLISPGPVQPTHLISQWTLLNNENAKRSLMSVCHTHGNNKWNSWAGQPNWRIPLNPVCQNRENYNLLSWTVA